MPKRSTEVISTPAKRSKSSKTITKKKTYGFNQSLPGLTRQLTSVNMGVGFPKRAFVRHRYSDTVVLTSSLGAMANYIFRCNGMYDPDFTGTGHQPMYYDQYGALYNYYTVLASKITVEFSKTADTVEDAAVAITLNDDGTVVNTQMRNIREQSDAKTGIVTTDRVVKLKSNFDLAKRFGTTNPTASQYTADINNNPTELCNYVLSVQATIIPNSVEVTATVLIEYDVMWYEIRDVSGS